MQVAEPFSNEAMLFTKELVLQREVSGVGGGAAALPFPSLVRRLRAFFRLLCFHTSRSKF